MSEPVVIVMEPVVIRGRRPGVPRPESVVPATPGLSNRAAGRIRAQAAAPEETRFGGFGYERTAQDEADVERAARARAQAPPTPAADEPGDEEGASVPAPTADSGGFAYERTAQDEGEVAAADRSAAARTDMRSVEPDFSATPEAEPLDHESGAPGEPSGEPRGVPGEAPSSPAAMTAAATQASVVGAPAPGSVTTPEELVSGMRTAAEALPHGAPEPAPLSAVFEPRLVAASARAARSRSFGGGRMPPPQPLDPVKIDPVPEATKKIQEALDNELPKLALPTMPAVPDGVKPVLGPVKGVGPGELDVKVPVAQPGADSAKVNTAEAARKKTAVARAKVPPEVVEKPAEPLDPPVLLDFRPKPPPPLPKIQQDLEKGQVARVLAIVKADLQERAKDLVDAVRDAAFPPKGMGDFFPEVTDPLHKTIEGELGARMDVLADAAGVGVEELKTAVAQREGELKAHQKHVATEAELVVTKATAELAAKAERENAKIDAAKRRAEAKRVQRLKLALHSRNPALVEELVTQRLTYIGQDVGRGVVAIEAARDRRRELLKVYRDAYQEAYRKAADAYQTRMLAVTPPKPIDKNEDVWLNVATDSLVATFKDFDQRTVSEATARIDTLQAAGLATRTAVREWSDKRLRHHLTQEQKQLRAVVDVGTQLANVLTAKAEAERAGVRDQLLGEIRFASAAYLQMQDEDNKVCGARAIELDQKQMEAARGYLAAGDPKDPMSAVAASLVARDQGPRQAARAEAVQKEILAKVPTDEKEAAELADIYFPNGSGELWKRVDNLWEAFEVWHGTAEGDAISALTGVDGPAMKLLNQAYEIRHKEGLQWRIGDEMSGSDYDQAAGLAGNDGGPLATQARQRHARGVIADSDGIFSNDANRALEAIRNLPPGEADAVVEDDDTREHLNTVLGGRRWVDTKGGVDDDRGERELQVLLQINRVTRVPGEPVPGAVLALQAKADAIEMDRFVRRGTGSDAPDIDKLFARIRASVLADPRSSAWSAEEVDQEVRRRTRAMEVAYEREFGAELPPGGMSALRTAMGRYLWGTNKQIAQDLMDVNRAGERAARLQRTTEGLYTSDSEMNAELERTYKDALAEVRRADSYRDKIETLANQLMEKDGITAGGKRPRPAELEAYRREATEKLASDLAFTWMQATSKEFGARYAARWGGNAEGALRYMVEDTTQFNSEDEALARLDNGGGLTAAQAVQFGVAGWGMDRDPVVGALAGRTKQQLVRIKAEYKENTKGEDMEARLQSETGDWSWSDKDTSLERDAFDIKEALRGVPTTPEEVHAADTRRINYEENVYFKDNPYERESAVGPQLALMREAYARSSAAYARYESARKSGDERAMRRAEAALGMTSQATTILADHYREAVDKYVDRSAQIAAIVGAVVVGIVASAFLGPVGVALAASLAGTVMSMATKQAILGAAYSRHALTNDLIVGVVDAIVTVLTARLGNILLKLPKPTGATRAALQASMRAIEAQRLAKPVLQRMAAFTAEQIAQSVPSAVAGAMLDRGTWRGDPLRNVATAAGMAAMIGVGVGTAIHGATTYGPKVLGVATDAIRTLRSGSGAEIAADRVLLRSTAESLLAGDLPSDALARRGSPIERLAARREYLRQFPDRTAADFNRALAEGTADAVASAEAMREVRSEMMRHFMEGIPAAERGRFVDTPIIMMPDAEFTARSGSGSQGHAVTLIVDGEPVVVIREGAPLSVLREEGMHARQIRDALNAERVALLDERSLAEWASTSLEDRVRAWHAKLDLELEVQSRLMSDLDAELSRPGLSAERAADLVDRLEDAHAAFDVLSQRRRTLLDLDAGEFDRIRAGDLDPPHFLAEEPRLFSKKALTPEEAGVRIVGAKRVFPEAEFKEGSRRSRWVKVYDDYGNLVEHYLERYGKNGWRKSGQVGRWGGGVAEIAMRMENAQRVGVDANGVKRVQLDAQTARGWGFDDVIPEFRRKPDGSVHAEIVVGEGKDYAGAVSDFSAVDRNFKNNLKRVRDRLDHLLRTKTWAAAGLDEAEVRAAIKAVDERRVRIEVRTSDSTHIVAGSLEDIQKRLRRSQGKGVSVTRGANISPKSIAEAEQWWDTIERYRLGGTKVMTDADAHLFRELAQRPTGITPQSIEVAEAVVMARREPGSLIDGNVRWEPDGRYLVDGKGRPFVVHTVRPSGSFDAEEAARAIMQLADQRVTPPGAPASALMRVVVDFGGLNLAQATELRAALSRQAKSKSQRAALDRLMTMFFPGAAKPRPFR